MLSGMKEWRHAHPQATLREIEEAVTQRMSRLTARMIQDLALASPVTEWRIRGTLFASVPRCPSEVDL